jgi:hypothetical protein
MDGLVFTVVVDLNSTIVRIDYGKNKDFWSRFSRANGTFLRQ